MQAVTSPCPPRRTPSESRVTSPAVWCVQVVQCGRHHTSSSAPAWRQGGGRQPQLGATSMPHRPALMVARQQHAACLLPVCWRLRSSFYMQTEAPIGCRCLSSPRHCRRPPWPAVACAAVAAIPCGRHGRVLPCCRLPYACAGLPRKQSSGHSWQRCSRGTCLAPAASPCGTARG